LFLTPVDNCHPAEKQNEGKMHENINAAVCEAQTHYLGEEGDALPATIKRITIS
jgi:hypothetical protein